jgi:hypothetical protein
MQKDELITNAGPRGPAAGGGARRADTRSLAVAAVVGPFEPTMSQMASTGSPGDPRPYLGRRRAPRSLIRRIPESRTDAHRNCAIRFLMTLANSISGTTTAERS